MREKLDLPLWQKGSCIHVFDVFAAHRSDEFLSLLANKKIRVVFVRTNKLQEIDLIPKKVI